MEPFRIAPFRVAYVPGVMPGKWERIWKERRSRPLELVQVEVTDQERVLDADEADMALVRGEIDRDRMHLIPLYREAPVVVVPAEHPVSAYDEIDVAELSGELDVLAEFPEITVKQAIETVAAGTGIVIVPMSLARLYHRKDVVHRPVLAVEESPVGLAWPREPRESEEDVQAFIGIVRGRSSRSSRT